MDRLYEERLGRDPVLPLILKMAMPAVAAQFINLLYNIVDRIYIGHIDLIGTDALAGVGVTSSIILLITAFSSIVGAGGAPLAAIALGRDDRRRAGAILGNGFVLLLIFTVFITSLTYFYMDEILIFSGASSRTVSYASDYLSIYMIGTLFVLIATGLNTFISCQGRPAVAMWSVVIGAALNIVLDPLFIFVLDWGVRGAAAATVISQAVSAVWILHFLLSDEATLKLEKKALVIDFKVTLSIVGLCMSHFVMASTESLVALVLNSNLKEFGDIYVSALAVMMTAVQFVSVPMVGFAQGFVPVISYNYGRGKDDRVRQGCRISVLFMFLFNFMIILLMVLFPKIVASIFSNDRALIQTVGKHMPLFLAGMTIFGLQRAFQNIFVALGQAKISIFIALLRKVILLVPLAILLPEFMGVKGIFAAEAISDATAAICCTLLFCYFFPRILKCHSATS